MKSMWDNASAEEIDQMIMDRYKSGMQGRDDKLQSQRDELKGLNEKDISGFNYLDLAPIAQGVDLVFDTNTSKLIKGNKNLEEHQSKIASLKNLINKGQDGLNDDQLNYLKMRGSNELGRYKANASASVARDKAAGLTNWYEREKRKGLGRQAKEWMTKDRSNFSNNLLKVQRALGNFEEAKNENEPMYGALRGRVWDGLREITNPRAINTRDAVQSAIQDTLRPTLGAQFTEKEGERIMSFSLREGASDEENQTRVRLLGAYIQAKIAATDELHRHLEQNNGSTLGFDFDKHSVRLNKLLDAGGELGGGSDSGDSAESSGSGGYVLMFDPQSGKELQVPQADVQDALAEGARLVGK